MFVINHYFNVKFIKRDQAGAKKCGVKIMKGSHGNKSEKPVKENGDYFMTTVIQSPFSFRLFFAFLKRLSVRILTHTFWYRAQLGFLRSPDKD